MVVYSSEPFVAVVTLASAASCFTNIASDVAPVSLAVNTRVPVAPAVISYELPKSVLLKASANAFPDEAASLVVPSVFNSFPSTVYLLLALS